MKRIRTRNFSADENDCLIELVQRFRDKLENKKTDAVSTKEKNVAWKQLEKDFNAIMGTDRSAVQLQCRYKKLKHEAKKRHEAQRIEAYKLQGCNSVPPNFSASSPTAGNVVKVECESLESAYDCDATSSEFDEMRASLKTEANAAEAEIPNTWVDENEALGNDGTLPAHSNKEPFHPNSFASASPPSPTQSLCSVQSEEPGPSNAGLTMNNHMRHTWDKWNSGNLRPARSRMVYRSTSHFTPAGNMLNAKTADVVAQKNELSELQKVILEADLAHKQKEHECRLRALELDIEIKQVELEIKRKTLEKLQCN